MRISLLLTSILLVLMTTCLTAQAKDPSQPNIIILLADDLGYGELGCQGNPQIPTPHIDSIAASGVRFTNGYVTDSYCSPSRAGLITGRYQQRFGYTYNVMPHVPGGSEHGLPTSETTLADQLRLAGYATGAIGKWHLGARRDFHPLARGFDSFFGFAHEGHFYVPPPYNNVTTMLRKDPLPNGRTGRWTSPDGIVYHDMLRNEPLYDLHNPLLRGYEEVNESRYLTNAFTDEAVQFIEQHQEKPFFLYLAYNAIHSPLQGADAQMKKFAHIEDLQRRIFAAMLANLDDSVGTVLEKLRELNLEDDTLIFFLSDNGGPTKELTSSNLPFSGGKGSLEEGGIRIPFMVRWDGVFPRGVVETRPVLSLDIFATAMAAAGRPAAGGDGDGVADIDGVDLTDYLTGEHPGQPHETLYWQWQTQAALRQGDWKLLRRKRSKTWQLYNLAEDVTESRDLASDQPSRLAEMIAVWEKKTNEMAH